MSDPVLSIRGLRTTFETAAGVFPAVDGIDLDLHAGDTLCVVGESGCGKSVTALSILRLIPEPPGHIEAGEIRFYGQDLMEQPLESLRKIRGNRIAMIFQEPMTSLNPVFRVGDQIEEVLRVHTDMDRAARRARGARAAGPRRYSGARAPRARLSPPALRRHATANHDRDGAGLQPGRADRR